MKYKFKLTVFKGAGRQPFYYKIQARNGEVIAPSEGYKTKAAAKKRANYWIAILDSAFKMPVCVLEDLCNRKKVAKKP